MRKGLTTLMTVAIALASVQAWAMAPVISDIPSPVVGNGTGPSQLTRYVYKDAFDLSKLATDDNTPTASLKWSYEIVGTPKYVVNGDDPINSGIEDPINPTANKIIAGAGAVQNKKSGATAATGEDGQPNTLTIRNVNLYPYGGSPSNDMTAAAQSWSANQQAVTFWCSDGNLASSQTVLFYTDNTYTNNQPSGWNRLSYNKSTAWKMEKQDNLDGKSAAWHVFDPLIDKCTSHPWTDGKGICFDVATTGANFGSYQSPMPFFTLTNNKIYRIRAKMNSTQNAPGHTPFWDFIVENWNGNAAEGINMYGMDSYYLDNEGGANTVVTTPTGTDMTMYWAPAAFQTSQWKSTAYTSSYDGVNDPCLRFRVLDVDSNTALLNNLKFGAICLQSVTVESLDFSQMTTVSNLVNIDSGGSNPPKQTTKTATGNMIVTQLMGTSVVFSGNVLKLTPMGNATAAELVEVRPATDTAYTLPSNDILDDWPIAWNPNQILDLAVNLYAPDSNSAAHPFDVMWLSIEPPTNEMITESYITATKAISTPKYASGPSGAQTYHMFYWTGNGTKSSSANLHNLRWRVRFGNATSLNWPNGTSDTSNNGSVCLSKVQVNVVSFPK